MFIEAETLVASFAVTFAASKDKMQINCAQIRALKTLVVRSMINAFVNVSAYARDRATATRAY